MKAVVGIVGTIASGKNLAAAYIAERLQIPHQQISAPLKKMAAARGVSLTRENLIAFGTTIAHEFGEDYLARLSLERIVHVGIISGMRQLAQIEFLRKHSDLFLLAIDADPAIRFRRAQLRNAYPEADTLGTFAALEKQENSGAHVQRLFECMSLSDAKIVNDGMSSELFRALDMMMSQWTALASRTVASTCGSAS